MNSLWGHRDARRKKSLHKSMKNIKFLWNINPSPNKVIYFFWTNHILLMRPSLPFTRVSIVHPTFSTVKHNIPLKMLQKRFVIELPCHLNIQIEFLRYFLRAAIASISIWCTLNECKCNTSNYEWWTLSTLIPPDVRRS